MEILHFLRLKSVAYKQERLQIKSGLWWRAYGTLNIRHLVDELFVPSAKRTSVLCCRLLLLRAVLPVHVFLTPFSCLMVKSIALSYGIPKRILEINKSPSMCSGKKMGDVQIIQSTRQGFSLLCLGSLIWTKNFASSSIYATFWRDIWWYLVLLFKQWPSA
mgnify:CR=1 FL=1